MDKFRNEMEAVDYKGERKALGYTQSEAAATLGVTQVTIARRETGAQTITREAWLALLSLPKKKVKK